MEGSGRGNGEGRGQKEVGVATGREGSLRQRGEPCDEGVESRGLGCWAPKGRGLSG